VKPRPTLHRRGVQLQRLLQAQLLELSRAQLEDERPHLRQRVTLKRLDVTQHPLGTLWVAGGLPLREGFFALYQGLHGLLFVHGARMDAERQGGKPGRGRL